MGSSVNLIQLIIRTCSLLFINNAKKGISFTSSQSSSQGSCSSPTSTSSCSKGSSSSPTSSSSCSCSSCTSSSSSSSCSHSCCSSCCSSSTTRSNGSDGSYRRRSSCRISCRTCSWSCPHRHV